ncbi:related to capsule-associated protein-like protein [Sporisorium reilianum f. sp. reilianum]|uniref:Related to capsule-associated protein-like protein n=1 Tax=Sporisorium reilianum f. sp. reilianum TaxID=72559 RepID=A0A2N8UKB5_9BASI|nr:related to capsule-associated protein-like protein [Sporisorium reilianum f. sp. reilianum]
MEKYTDATDMEKVHSLASSSTSSSYPPSPRSAPAQPAWASSTGASQSLRQRMLSLFDSHTSARLRGYALAPDAPNESGQHLPLYSPGGSSAFHRLVRTPRQSKFFRIICLVLLLGVPYALYTASTSTAATVTTPIEPLTEAAGSDIKGWLNQHEAVTEHEATKQDSQTPEKPVQAISHAANLDDSQCLGVLQGGADAIICHVELAQRKFNAMISRQSKTYPEAVARYVQQYKRDPPPGFDQWFQFAQQNNATIIDDYGQLEKDPAPLRRIPAAVLRQRMKTVRERKVFRLMHQWDFVNGTLKSSAPDDWEVVRSYRSIMAPFVSKMPNFSVLQNWDDNMKVCGPGGVEDVNDPNVALLHRTGLLDARDYLTNGCPRNTATDSPVTSDRPSVNMCTRFDDLKDKHGLTHMYGACINSTIPVLSTTRVSTFQDITTASWCYGDPNYRLTNATRDVIPYARKKNSIYWRGSNTGSRANLQFSFQTHRVRLVMMAHQMKLKATELAARIKAGGNATTFSPADYNRVGLPNMPATFSQAQLSALSRLDKNSVDMNFVNLHYCDKLPKFCDEWKATIPLATREPAKTAFENKFVMDLDGNSMSGRFYRMLDSNSLVFKQTVYVEWHDDRIVPWLHYVPVHVGFEELPILIDFFSNHPKGQQLGAMMADASKQWAASTLRKIDLSVYTYRQMLELANIIGHD